jgi:tRNA 2-thiouridine synthesizing protein A
MPVIRLQNAVSGIGVGDQVEITCTDPGVKNDIPAWCRINGHSIEDIREENDEIVILVSKLHDD